MILSGMFLYTLLLVKEVINLREQITFKMRGRQCPVDKPKIVYKNLYAVLFI